MPARAYWTGQLRLSLVSIPVQLHAATKTASRIAFHQIHEPSGKRVRYEKVVPGIGPIETGDIVKGYEVDKGRDAAGLVAAAQIGVLELHIWGSRIGDVERPDRIVFDLDPDVELRLTELKKAALDIREMLETVGLTSLVMATGGKGLHLVCPITPNYEWPEVKAFCRAIAETLASQQPERFTANIRKATRKGRIFVDCLRNDRTSTAICPYSTRNKPGGAIAVPLAWDALKSLKSAHPITLRDGAAIDRLLADDPWAGYGSIKQSLPLDRLLGEGEPKPKRGKRG